MTAGTRCSCRRLLLGHAGFTSPIRRRDLLHGSDIRAATCRTRPIDIIGNHAEAIEIIFDPQTISYRRFWSFSSRFTTQARAIARATTSGRATDLRSSTPVTSRSGLPKTPSPTSMLQACGRARSLRKSFRQATSGRPNPSIRIISNDIPTATPAISSGPTGDCRFAPTRLQSRRNSRSSSKSHVRRCAMQCTAPVRSTVRAGRIPWVTTKRRMQCPKVLLGQCGPSAWG